MVLNTVFFMWHQNSLARIQDSGCTPKKTVLVIVDDQCPNTKHVQPLKGQTSMYPHLLFIAIASALLGHQGWWSCIRVALLRVGTSSVPVAPPLKRRLAEALQQCLILDATEEDMLTRLEWVDGMGQGSYECVGWCHATLSTWEKA